MESAEPNGVVSGREVEEYNACLFTRLKRVLDVVGEEGDLVHRRLPVAETRLLLRQLGSITRSMRVWRRRPMNL